MKIFCAGCVGVFHEYVLVCRFTDTVDVIQAIVSHPDPEVSKHLKIGRLSLQSVGYLCVCCDNVCCLHVL